MKLIDVVDGGRYQAKVSGRLVTVTVLSRHVPSTGRLRVRLVCRNERTGREIRCSAARLRGPAPAGPREVTVRCADCGNPVRALVGPGEQPNPETRCVRCGFARLAPKQE